MTVTIPPPFADADLFDEAGYLRLYPGLAEAIMQGVVDSAWTHYQQHGKGEGRQANDVDPGFYLSAYPGIEQDLGRPPAPEDAAPHYITLGRARGFLPNASAPRPTNGAAPGSPFGGFWVDQANALDLIQGRLDLGWIRRREAAMLRTFALDGIVELDRVPDREQVRDAALIVAQAFTGMFPDLLFGSEEDPSPWRPQVTEQHVAALDPHVMSRKIREVVFDKAITDLLSQLFESLPKLTASRAYLRQSMIPDRDVAQHAFTLPLRFAAVTFSLEDPADNHVALWPGSHRLPDLPWAGEHLALPEARRAGARFLEQAVANREATVRDLVRRQEPRRLGLPAGTRMVRHANLIHGVNPPEPPLQWRTLTAWYCPSHVEPCFMETRRARVHDHDGFSFLSGVYPASDPSD